MPTNILFLAANPTDTSRLRLDREVREIEEGLRGRRQRDQFVLTQKWAVRPNDLRRAMLDYEPRIVHFSGHGAGQEGILLENDEGLAQTVTAEAIKGLFELFPKVECVLLNACYSQVQAEAIATTVKHVIGMSQAIGDNAAIQFACSFYDAIGAGQSIEFAYRLGCNALQMNNIPGHLTPVLISRTKNIPRSQPNHQMPDMSPSPLRLPQNVKAPKYDVFVSHAWEDRDIAAKLSEVLQREGLEVWFSGCELRPGDRLRRSIDRGVVESRYGLVILSQDFLNLSKYWTQYELDGLTQLEVEGRKVIIPVWFNVTASGIRSVAPSLADRIAIPWTDDLQSVMRQVLSVVRPVPKSQRRATLERQVFDRIYHYEDAISPALRLVGAGTEFFTANDVLVAARNEPYLIPIKYRNKRDALVAELLAEAASSHKVMFDGPATRLLSYQILVPDPITERKALRLVLGPLGYFDYAVTRRLSDAAMQDDGIDRIDEFVDVAGISAGEDTSSNSLSNIVDTATTVISSDGYLLYVERTKQVSDRTGWHTSAVAENIHAIKDGVDFSNSDWVFGLPFRTAMRGLAEELSPRLNEILDSIGWEKHLRMLGISFDLEGFHPDLLFLLTLPLTHAEIKRICREFPGNDASIEGALKSAAISEGGYDIVRKLATTRWTPGGAASVIRSLEYLSSVSREHRLGSLQEAIDWILSGQSGQ